MPAIVLFDGVCNLCNGFVQFAVARDPESRLRFGALQSEAARRLVEGLRIPGPLPDSLVLVEDGRAYLKSTAALRIARRLRAPWPLAYGFIVVPRALRDLVYDFVARRRYRWFGRRDRCMVPTPGLGSRFIDGRPPGD